MTDTWFLVQVPETKPNEFHDWVVEKFTEATYIMLDDHLMKHTIEEVIQSDQEGWYKSWSDCEIHDTTNR